MGPIKKSERSGPLPGPSNSERGTLYARYKEPLRRTKTNCYKKPEDDAKLLNSPLKGNEVDSTATARELGRKDCPEILISSPEDQVLGNELLLQLIFGSFENPSEDLRKVRLVSKDFQKLAMSCLQENNWNNRNFLVLNGSEDMKKYVLTFNRNLSFPGTRGVKGRQALAALETETPIAREQLFFQCYIINLMDPYYGRISEKDMATATLIFYLLSQCMQSLKLSVETDNDHFPLLQKILSTQSSSLKELKICVKLISEEKTTTRSKKQKEQKKLQHQDSYKDDELKLVNLDYLSLKIKRVGSTTFGPAITILPQDRKNILENLLKKIPEEKYVRISLVDWSDINATVEILQQYQQIKNLNFFDINYLNEGEELKILGEGGVKLESLSAMTKNTNGPPMPSSTDTKKVYEFLCTQVQNLEKLSWGSNWRFKFPVHPMIGLKKLKLISCSYMEQSEDNDENENVAEALWNSETRPIFYYDLFPNLEQLHLECLRLSVLDVETFQTWFLSPQLPSTSIKKLEVDYGRLDAQIFDSISNIFPHLTSLAIGPFPLNSHRNRKNVFKALWNAEFAHTLEELSIVLLSWDKPTFVPSPCIQPSSDRIWKKYELDSLFSGVSEEIIEQITQSFDYENFTCQPEGSILNFKNLKVLEIHGNEGERDKYFNIAERCHFTDFSVFCVFGKLTKLCSFYFPSKMRNFITKEGAVELQRKIRSLPRIPYQVSPEDRMEVNLKHVFRANYHSLTKRWKCNSRNSKDFRDLNLDQEPEQDQDYDSTDEFDEDE